MTSPRRCKRRRFPTSLSEEISPNAHTVQRSLRVLRKAVQMTQQKAPSLAGDFVKSKTDSEALKAHKENDLILQDIPVEDLSKTTATDTENVADEVESVGSEDSFMNRFYSLHYRECPLTIPRNMEGLVDSRTFWKDSISFRNGLYDSCHPETKVQKLRAVTFPVKQMNGDRNTQIPDNNPNSISIMAQYLYNQMAEQRSKMENNIKCVEADNECDIGELRSQSGPNEVKSRDKESPMLKKSLRARVMGFLRKFCCCVQMNVGE